MASYKSTKYPNTIIKGQNYSTQLTLVTTLKAVLYSIISIFLFQYLYILPPIILFGTLYYNAKAKYNSIFTDLAICSDGLAVNNQFYNFTEIEEITVNFYLKTKGVSLYKIDHKGFSILLKNGNVIQKMTDEMNNENLITAYLFQINQNIHNNKFDFEAFSPISEQKQTIIFDENTFKNEYGIIKTQSNFSKSLSIYFRNENDLLIKIDENIFQVFEYEKVEFIEFENYSESIFDLNIYFIDKSYFTIPIDYHIKYYYDFCKYLKFKVNNRTGLIFF